VRDFVALLTELTKEVISQQQQQQQQQQLSSSLPSSSSLSVSYDTLTSANASALANTAHKKSNEKTPLLNSNSQRSS
jgi:hypothetical protein